MTEPLPKLSELVGADNEPAPEQLSFFARFEQPSVSENNVVRRSAEFDRIAALPRRKVNVGDPVPVDADLALARVMTGLLRTKQGSMELRPIQARALHEAQANNGAFCPIGVGMGKTLFGLLLPTVLDSRRAVYLTNPGLVAQVNRDMERFAKHWDIRCNNIEVVSYSFMSTKNGLGALEHLQPDLIYADEAHALRHATATRTKRVMRYLNEHPECRFVAASGTITSKSIRDYAHLCGRALRQGAPVPLTWSALDEWARALDVDPGFKQSRNKPGALLDFCAPGEEPRDGYRRRLVETPGVVATTESALGTGLEIRALAPRFQVCKDLVAKCTSEGAWEGVDLDPLAEARVVRQLALGFHYKWDWPNGVIDQEWLEARNAWNRAVRRYMLFTNTPGLDSPMLIAAAADRNEAPIIVRKALDSWRDVEERPEPPVVPVWHNDLELVHCVLEWWEQCKKDKTNIVWYEHQAVGDLLADELDGLLIRPEKGRDPADLKGHNLLLSIKQHGTGRNLQAWNRNLVLTPPSSGAMWEQLIGRTHRPGQASDTVTFDVLQHVGPYRSALETARGDARYIESSTGLVQKLGLATFVDFEQ